VQPALGEDPVSPSDLEHTYMNYMLLEDNLSMKHAR
jgi:hypothetical protein